MGSTPANIVPTQPDLFALKGSVSFRDDWEMMALPFFSISKTPRRNPIEHRYEVKGEERYVRVTGGEKGIATIWDNDVLIYARTLIAGKIVRGEPVTNSVVFTVNDFLIATGRDTGSKAYQAFYESIVRLQTTTVFTNIAAGEFIEDSGFGWLQSFRLRKRKRASGSEVLAACEITLCDWLFNAIVAQRFLSIERSYFDLSGALERKLWLIVRKHLGKQPRWWIAVDKLRDKCASQQDNRRFRHDVKKLIERDPFPEFALSLSNDSNPLIRAEHARNPRALYLVAQPRRTILAQH